MKTMVLSDIHGKAPALKKALDIFNREEFDQLFILGDILYHGPRNPLPPGYEPAAVPAMLNEYKDRILAIRGNCDSEVDQMLLEFPIMGDYALYREESRRFILTHGHLEATRLPAPAAGDIVLSGHTHIPQFKTEKDSCRFNPGSISLPKGGFPPTYGVIEEGNLQVRQLESGEILYIS